MAAVGRADGDAMTIDAAERARQVAERLGPGWEPDTTSTRHERGIAYLTGPPPDRIRLHLNLATWPHAVLWIAPPELAAHLPADTAHAHLIHVPARADAAEMADAIQQRLLPLVTRTLTHRTLHTPRSAEEA